MDLQDLHVFHTISLISRVGTWQPVPTCGDAVAGVGAEVQPLQKSLLDPGCLALSLAAGWAGRLLAALAGLAGLAGCWLAAGWAGWAGWLLAGLAWLAAG